MDEFFDADATINDKDEIILSKLQTQEPAILDEVTDYHLNCVGCATTDITVVRMASFCAHLAFENVLNSARVASKLKLGEHASEGMNAAATNGKELSMDNFIVALKQCDDMFVSPGLDFFIDGATSFENEEIKQTTKPSKSDAETTKTIW